MSAFKLKNGTDTLISHNCGVALITYNAISEINIAFIYKWIYIHLQEERDKLKKDLEDKQWKIKNMQQNIKDMTSFQNRMEKTTKKTQAQINDLQ